MLVDIQIAKPQTAYKREQLSQSYKSDRRARKPRAGRTRWLTTRVRRPSVA